MGLTRKVIYRVLQEQMIYRFALHKLAKNEKIKISCIVSMIWHAVKVALATGWLHRSPTEGPVLSLVSSPSRGQTRYFVRDAARAASLSEGPLSMDV